MLKGETHSVIALLTTILQGRNFALAFFSYSDSTAIWRTAAIFRYKTDRTYGEFVH
jgi:hypothetical protein